MKVKTRISLSQGVIVLLVLLMAAVAFASIRSTRYYVQRVQWAERQLEAITATTMHANRYSEQIAELMLLGSSQRSDYEDARNALDASFKTLEQVTQEEAAFMIDRGRQEDSRDELHRVSRMRTLRDELDHAVSQLMQMEGQGDASGMIEHYRSQIENRLDAEFEHLLIAAMLDEQEEVDAVDRQFEGLWKRLSWTIAMTTLLAMAVCAVLARQLYRTLVQPVTQLTAGAEAISNGNLAYRIVHDGRDELGLLAKRFNQMAVQVQQQRLLLLGAQARLEREVEERTHDLGVANARLTELDRSRVQFLTDISHELRTPLTALRGEAEVTLRHAGRHAAAYREALERIVKLSADMGRLVDDLLFLARTETETLRFVMQPVELGKMLTQLVDESSALGRAKAIEVQLAPPPPLWVRADIQRLRQACMIVIDNAIKYSAQGQTISLSATQEGAMAAITVRDQGCGIGADELPHVFDRFYRGMTPDVSGHGLGLPIARWLMEKHGGEIAMRSEQGQYTEVCIRLPVLEGGRA